MDEVEQKAANQIQGCDNKKSTVQSEQGEVSDADEAANNETNVDMKEKQFKNKTGANETMNGKFQYLIMTL